VINWHRKRLDDLITIKHGFAFKGEFFRDSPPGDILLTPGNFAIGGGFKASKLKYYVGSVPDEYVLRQGDLIVTMTDLSKQADTLGYPALIPRAGSSSRYLHNQRLGKVLIRDRANIEPRFLYYVMCSRKYRNEIIASATGTTVKHTSPNRIKRFELQLPPLCDQQVIASILGSLDDKIELNRRMNETLETTARAIFQSWFVDFDPVRAKMDGRWKRGRSLPGLPAELYDLFPDRLADSELGEIPKSWEVGTLADLSRLNPESWLKETRPPQIKYVDLSNTKRGRIESVTTYAKEDAPSRAQRILRPGDTIVGTVRPGNGSYAMISGDGLTGSTGFAVLRPTKPADAEFVYLAATAAENIEALAHLADGGAYPAVRPEVVSTTRVIMPPDGVLIAFSRVAGPVLAKSAENERQSRTLSALRDSLLPKLISGELQISTAATLVSAQQ